MYKIIPVSAAAVLTFALGLASLAHAADDYLAQIYGTDPAPKGNGWARPEVKVAGDAAGSARPKSAKFAADAKACETSLDGRQFVPGSSLELVETDNPVEDILKNQPILVSREQLAPDSDENRLAQLAAMRQLARQVSELILSPEYLGTENAQIKVQTLLQNGVGLVPARALTHIDGILNANLSSLTNQNSKPRYRRNADNALAELTRVVTSYRKSGLDINTFANLSSRISELPLFGRPFKGLDVVLRERFQTVKDAILANDQVLETSIAEMLLRHEQMKDARLECRSIERYLELTMAIVEEVSRLVSEYLESTNPSEDQRARFQKVVQTPLATSLLYIQRNQTTVMTAYHQFALLMDGNRDMIGIITNLRGTARLSISVFGAGRIIANEQQKTMNLAKDTIMAVDDLTQQTIAQIRRQGVEIRDFPNVIIKSTSQMIGHMDILLAELQLAQESQGVILERLGRASSIFKVRIEEARKKSAQYDLVRLADLVTDLVTKRRSDRIDQTPVLP